MPAASEVEPPREGTLQSSDLVQEEEILAKPSQRHLQAASFLASVQRILLEHVQKSWDRAGKVVNWKDPRELVELLDLEVGSTPSSPHSTIIRIIRDTLKYSVNTAHPYFVNQLFSGVDPIGLAGQWVCDALNSSVYTYEVAPVFTLMEEEVLSGMRGFVGWSDGDGVFAPGGSFANGYAINIARHHLFPQIKKEGMGGVGRLVMFTSEDAHYSVKKMAALEGLGTENVLLVRTDDRGKMETGHLQQLISQQIGLGHKPFLVSATAGTTVLGAFDPLEEIAEICKKYKMWLHVDAAWGGGALFSNKYKDRLQGIHRADSVTWNPHKMLGAPQQCSTLLTRHPNLLQEAHSASAHYLFQKDKFYDTSYDTGDKHLQCGRRPDVFKFFLMWKAKGNKGLARHVEKLFENSEYFTEQIRNREGFELVLDHPECTNVSFWYIPPSLRQAKHLPHYKNSLHKVAPLMKERMMREGTLMMTYQPQKELPNFFRLVLQNSELDHSDMDHIISEIERLGRDL